MIGKIRKKLISLEAKQIPKAQEVVCPICDRPIPESQKDAHHLWHSPNIVDTFHNAI